LGASIPIAQAMRGKNDAIAWLYGGFAAGAVFALRSKLFLIPQFDTVVILEYSSRELLRRSFEFCQQK